MTIQNLRQFDFGAQLPSPSADIRELNEHVHLLEQKLHQRDYELQTLQIEIEKGTSSIMSSIEDLYLASSSVSPTPTSTIVAEQQHDSLQRELDQLHDRLDELTRENQALKSRSQEFETIYEENEYLYAEQSQWNEEMERARVRILILEQDNRALKEREREILGNNEPDANTGNPAQLKLKIDWLYQTNNKLDLEIVNLREQFDSMTRKCQELKKDLSDKDKHYQQILAVAEEQQQLPQVGRHRHCSFSTLVSFV